MMHARPDDDVLRLDDLCEPSLVGVLEDRFINHRCVYTRAGTILIAINPFEWREELYTEEVMKHYRERGAGADGSESAPHPFEVAAMAHATMQRAALGTRHTIIISGESGAGKTEATKMILNFLVEAAAEGECRSISTVLRERILSANPLLEAFGNACTTRNENSSRFGKLIEISFARGARIEGARIVNYLLEKARAI